MISPEEIERLSALARLDVPLAEREALARDLGAVLNYVGQLKDAPLRAAGSETSAFSVLPSLRADGENAPRLVARREDLLNQMPDRAGDYLRVKKVL